MLEVRDQCIGTKVKLSARGKKQFQDSPKNPHDATGIFVFNDASEVMEVIVVWPNLMHNYYEADHLELA